MRGLLSPFISLLFRKSLSTGFFPTEFKEAIVRRLLKKSGLDSSQKKNYRPVSNLSFLSKLLERVAQARLETFLDSNDLMPTMPSVGFSGSANAFQIRYLKFQGSQGSYHGNQIWTKISRNCTDFTSAQECEDFFARIVRFSGSANSMLSKISREPRELP